MLTGYKTHILVILALVSGLALYVADVVSHGFSVSGLINFVNGEAMVGAISMLRLAIGKK
jgi:hypothetical protein